MRLKYAGKDWFVFFGNISNSRKFMVFMYAAIGILISFWSAKFN